jgi:hypothetical protein
MFRFLINNLQVSVIYREVLQLVYLPLDNIGLKMVY